MSEPSKSQTMFETLAGAEGSVGSQAAKNGLRHMASLSMTKVSDGLIDPKLVLSWLLSALGAPGVLVGALVPIREAGALLPQILLAGRLRAMTFHKWMWVAGSAGQGASALAIVMAALTLEGMAAGIAICLALAVLAVCRAACSVSYKDVLGKTVAKTQRGAVTGVAGSASSIAVVVFAAAMLAGLIEGKAPVMLAIALAAILWGAAAVVFATLREQPSEPDTAERVRFALLREDPDLLRFVLVRGALVGTALAPPYMVLLSSDAGLAALDTLGALLLASSAASFTSSYLWGRLSDRSSRWVMILAGGLGASAMIAAILLARFGLAQEWWAMPGALFVLMIAYHGVRQGRSTHLVDMAPENARAAYSALANTAIGLLLLAVGLLGGVGAAFGPQVSLALFALLACGGALLATTLPEVQRK